MPCDSRDVAEIIARACRVEPHEHSAHFNALHDEASKRLLGMLPQDQMDRVFASDLCDIGPDFLGFVGIYDRLAQIIPLSHVVVDLGCSYAAQAFFFNRHFRYIGVDLLTPVEARFAALNTCHYQTTIREFLAGDIAASLDRRGCFAICSYVPPWGDDNLKLAREAFEHVFTFYPYHSIETRSA